jgi:hypothetical protein
MKITTKPVNSGVSLGKQLHLVTDHLPVFCLSLSRFTNKSALRSISVISIRKPTPYYRRYKNNRLLRAPSTGLLAKTKSGHKTYSIRTLFELVKNDWIRPALHSY